MRLITGATAILWLIVILACPVWAAPAVDPITSATDGETLTITGSGFGSTGPTVYKWDDFESGTVGAKIATTNTANAWSVVLDGDDDHTTPQYANSTPRTGSEKYVRCYYGASEYCPDGVCSNSEFFWNNGTTPLSLYPEPAYITFYWRIIHAAGGVLNSANKDNMKVFRISVDGTQGTGDAPCVSFAIQPGSGQALEYPNMNMTPKLDNNSNPCTCWNCLSGYHPEEWLRIELDFTEEEVAGECTGEVRHFAQRAENGSFSDMVGFPCTDATPDCSNYSTNMKFRLTGSTAHFYDMLFGGWTRMTDTTKRYYGDFDDIYIARGRQRVEIGNAPVWANCTIREIQGTINSWADTSISIDVNQGAIPDGTAYLFVIDSDGTVSSAEEITLGGSSPSTPSIRNGGFRSGGIR